MQIQFLQIQSLLTNLRQNQIRTTHLEFEKQLQANIKKGLLSTL